MAEIRKSISSQQRISLVKNVLCRQVGSQCEDLTCGTLFGWMQGTKEATKQTWGSKCLGPHHHGLQILIKLTIEE